jgi:hypothetical protein
MILARIILAPVLLTAFSGCLTATGVQRNFVSSIPFDEKVWKGEKNLLEMSKGRLGMARDLIERKVLPGKTRGEIRDMLGWEKARDFPDPYVKYELAFFGMGERGPDPTTVENLKLTFGPDDKVESAEIELVNWRGAY